MKFLFLLLSPLFLFAKPHGAVTIAGDAHISHPNSKTMEIKTSERAIIQWKDFSIENGECAKFIQPSTRAAVLNRVSGNLLSRIDGLLEANGRVYLLNPNGILIGKQGVINTAEFIGSTFDVLDESFLKNQELLFQGPSSASLINYGTIKAADGDVTLFAKMVRNEGTIEAKQGEVNLVAAREIVLKPDGKERIFIVAGSEETEKAEEGVKNNGSIQAIAAHLMAEGNAYSLAICQTGEIEASGIMEKEGRIYLVADGGVSKVSGRLIAKNENRTGGKIEILGEKIGIIETAALDASGDFGGGEILIGTSGTEITVIENNTTIDVAAKIAGNGGKVRVWADGAAAFAGVIHAEGGSESGDGGFVEVSGKKYLNFDGLVSTDAPFGKKGMLLIDPTDVTISTAADSNNTFSGGNYTYTAGTANINNLTLQTNLGATNVTITTNSPFAAPLGGTITVNNAVTWASTSNLSLFAANNIVINQGLTNSNLTAGSISLSAQNNITMTGTPIGSPTIQTVGGGITLQAGGSILLQPSATNAVLIFPEIGGLTINAGLDLQLLGGGASQFVEIIGSATSNNVSVGRDLILTAGIGSGSFVQFLASPFGGAATMQFNVGRNVQLTGGSGGATQNYAAIGGSAVTTSILSNIAMAVGGDVSITGGSGLNAFAQIGHFPSATSAVTAVAANLGVAIGGNLTITGGTGANDSAILGFGNINSGLPSEALSGMIAVSAANISLVGGSASGALAALGFVSSATLSNVMPAEVDVASGNISLLGQVASAVIGYQSVSATPNAIINVNVNAEGTLQMDAPGTGEAAIINNVNTVSAPANVNIHFKNGVIGTGAGTPGNVEIYSSSDLVMIADQSMHLGNISNIHTISGQISLVVDNAFPSPPGIGPGQFIKDAGATITTAGPLRIFTATRAQNSIQGLINGVAFVPGPLFINSATERWGVYFFDPFGGFPFTIFYKNELPAYQNAYGIAISEALRDLKTYDDFLFVRIPIFLCYDLDNYYRPRGALSGYDFAEDEEYDMLRQRFRNYNTKYSESL
ncbi:MAG TPA: filamentous hemagglutinin N-terminal domain-containing protein [Rhabdochlamydiaceae bacterium]|nr:filamentous hemagglutinin N-terminal domain-containing protein [Rhabdochlamydiaceae bacterium]